MVKFIETESRIVVPCGRGRGEILFSGDNVSVLQDARILEMDGDNEVAQKCEYTQHC